MIALVDHALDDVGLAIEIVGALLGAAVDRVIFAPTAPTAQRINWCGRGPRTWQQ